MGGLIFGDPPIWWGESVVGGGGDFTRLGRIGKFLAGGEFLPPSLPLGKEVAFSLPGIQSSGGNFQKFAPQHSFSRAWIGTTCSIRILHK